MAAIIAIRVGSAIPTVEELVALLAAPLQALAEEVAAFRQAAPTPERTCAFEKKRTRFGARLGGHCSSTNTIASSLRGWRIVRRGCAWRIRNIGGGPRALTGSARCSARSSCGVICTRRPNPENVRCFPWRCS